MANNNSQVRAKKERNDEFYTQYSDIQKEINAYLDFNPDVFKGKTVLLPCDDPEWSNFTKFFAQNFEYLGLKKLISTSYSLEEKTRKYSYGYQYTLFEKEAEQFNPELSEKRGKIFTLTRDKNNSGNIDIDDLEWQYLEGNGDFRSEEVKLLRDEADIIVTNPPFSLFNDFIKWIYEEEKLFIIIGNIGSATYKEIFPLIKDNKMWLGATCDGKDMVFEVPEGAVVSQKDRDKAERMGYVGNYTRMGNCCWYTNIDHGRRHRTLDLMTMAYNLRYSKHKEIRENGYVTYDNYDAIEVNYWDAIPSDYEGIMGVSSSFLMRFCPEQFEIVGATQTGCHPDEMVLKTYKEYKGYKQDGRSTGRTGSTCGHNPMIAKNDGVHDYYMNDEGRTVQSANGRILIRKKV